MADDTVQLTDLEVIQQFSLAVRGATASRRDVIEALEADLAYLTSTRKPAAAPKPAPTPDPKPAATPVAKAAAPVKKAPAKKAAAKAPASKATRASRG